jgi:isopenicillin N synthase-like dioxygenase
MNDIPIISLAPLLRGGAEGLAQVGRQVCAACEGIGFFYVVDHGVAPRVIDDCFAAAAGFFALPLAERNRIPINRWNRGYMKLREVTVPGYLPDLKESFDLAVDLPEDDPDVVAGKPLHGANQWPELAGFRAPVEAYFHGVLELVRPLLTAFAVGLDLPEDFFAPMFARPLASMRLIHYPDQAAPVDREWGVAPHTDYGAFTLLSQDATGGLEVAASDGRWLPAPPVPHAFVVNIGDMMATWTNDRFRSNAHRVVNRSGRNRISIPFFLSPAFDTVVRCLESCASPANPAKYPPVGSGEYLLRKFDATYAFRKAGAAR